MDSAGFLEVETPAEIVSALSQLFPQFRVSNRRFYALIANSGSLIQTLDVLLVNYLQSSNNETKIKFYIVPSGVHFKPRRQTETREAILGEYTMDALEIFKKVILARIISPSTIGGIK